MMQYIMHYSQAYRSQEPNRLQPADGSIPMGFSAVEYSATESKELINPLLATADVVAEGARLYGINCSFCHGMDGKGDGTVGPFLQSNGYSVPPDLTATSTQGRTGGDLFSIVSFQSQNKIVL